ncbi:MAG TPA: cytochrome c oxidase assembly protein [Rhodanobacteraceae bacterium]
MSILAWFVPWEFSPTTIIVIVMTAMLYLRGSLRQPPGFWRQFCFWTGLVLIYLMLQTNFDYYAEREFFMHRVQHLVLHHMGPFLIIMALPGTTLRKGMPWVVRRAWHRFAHSAPVRFVFEVLFNPVVASFLFFGIILFWLYPPIHFIAMLDWRWYRVMNWSVTVDGLLFWWLILDRHAHPPARIAPGWRVFIPLFVAMPQVFAGAYMTFTRRELYPIYDLCGRAFSGISSMQSQHLGGLILWIPSAMMMVLGAMIAFRHWTELSNKGRLPPRKRLRGVPRTSVTADIVRQESWYS